MLDRKRARCSLAEEGEKHMYEGEAGRFWLLDEVEEETDGPVAQRMSPEEAA